MGKVKPNHLLEATVSFLDQQPRGKVLDLGCGDGSYAARLKELGFQVIAADIDKRRFRYQERVEFRHCDITKEIPFPNETFDYVLLMEVIEHLRNPYEVLAEIKRVIKNNCGLIISTPNIMNLNSRLRFLFEGAYEYFREPPLEQTGNPKEVIFNLHILPYRYHELEYLLTASGFKIRDIFTSCYEGYGWGFIIPGLKFQMWQKQRRSLKKGGVDHRRINRILLSKELLFGRHLVIHAQNHIK